MSSLRPKESKVLTLKDLLRVEIHGRIHEINVVHFSPELKKKIKQDRTEQAKIG